MYRPLRKSESRSSAVQGWSAFPILVSSLLLHLIGCGLAAAVARADELDFNRDVRPILSENCFFCHGQDDHQRMADVRLDVREAAMEARAIVPGDAESSTLIQRVLAEDPNEQMPPASSHRSLTDDQKETLRRWIDQGANYDDHWAFIAPVRADVPDTGDDPWVQNPVDAFVLTKMRSKGLEPSPQADRETLIRRLYADLIGFPPTAQECQAFVDDPNPDAYENLVDRLLNDPHYGERMAIPWLDAARYADSNGFQQDGDTWQWIWRDWVVRALNEDLPFDQFSIWQLAGDLLENPTQDQMIATAFNRNHLLNGEGGGIPEEQRFVILFDRMDTTSTNWLGMTIACAQCHSHKYDPVSQKEYYQLMDLFNRVPEQGVPEGAAIRIRVDNPVMELPSQAQAQFIASLEKQISEASEGTEDSIPDLKEADFLKKKLYDYQQLNVPRLMVMSDAQPRPTHVLNRGQYLEPLEEVSFATPAFLPEFPDELPRNRLGFAQWLFLPSNPLVARVQVNRIWQHFFGAGLVKTSEDFGVQSEYPVHKELLDWLAVEFREQGWKVKPVQRLILTSATYRQSSRVDHQRLELDAENRYYSRANRFRMPAMVLRDWALAASGLLEKEIGGQPVYPYQPSGVWEPLAITKERDFTYPASTGKDLYRRSIYTFWRRTISPANMFDSSNRQACRVRSSSSNTPLHSLTMLNDPTWVEASRVMAEKCIKSNNSNREQLRNAFHRILCRLPNDAELERLSAIWSKQYEFYSHHPALAEELLAVGASKPDPAIDANSLAAMTNVCLAIFNLDEALTRE